MSLKYLAGSGGGGGGSGTVTSVNQSLVHDDTETLSGGPVVGAGTLARTAVDFGADGLVAWIDGAGKKEYVGIGANLAISDGLLNASGGGGGGDLTVHSTAVNAGTANHVLFEGPDNILDESDDFVFDPSTKVLTLAASGSGGPIDGVGGLQVGTNSNSQLQSLEVGSNGGLAVPGDFAVQYLYFHQLTGGAPLFISGMAIENVASTFGAITSGQGDLVLIPSTANADDDRGGSILFYCGDGFGAGTGGGLNIQCGDAGPDGVPFSSGYGGGVSIAGGTGSASCPAGSLTFDAGYPDGILGGNSGTIYIRGQDGSGAAGYGGSIILKTGNKSGIGGDGDFEVQDVDGAAGVLTYQPNGDLLTCGNLILSASLTVAADRGAIFTNQTSSAAAQVGTLTNAPTAGNPGYWLKIKVGATNYAVPCWAG